MDSFLDKIKGPPPDICEAAHERLPPPRHVHGKDPRNLPRSDVTIAKSRPNNHPHGHFTPQRNAKAGFCGQKYVSRRPITSLSQKRRVTTQASNSQLPSTPNECTPCKPTSRPKSHSSTPVQKVPERLPKVTPSTPIATTKKHASNPRKHPNAGHREIPSMPSTSTLASSIMDPTVMRQQCAAPTPPKSPYAKQPLEKRKEMSERAAETVRIMEWAKGQVQSAEARVREHERAERKEREFMLQLRTWEAEMRLRRKMEDVEEETKREEELLQSEWLDRKMAWIGERCRMERCKNLIRRRIQRCWRGLASVLDR